MNPTDPRPTDTSACLQAMEQSMQIYEVAPLRSKALALLWQHRCTHVTTGALAVALAVPFWVADVVLDAMQEGGDAMFCGEGWRLSCSADVALALSLPASARAAGGR